VQYQREAVRRRASPAPAKAPPKPAAPAPPKAARTKLSHKEQRELEGLPAKIEALETEQAELERVLADPATYRTRAADVPRLTSRVQAIPTEVETLFARWEDLSSRSA